MARAGFPGRAGPKVRGKPRDEGGGSGSSVVLEDGSLLLSEDGSEIIMEM